MDYISMQRELGQARTMSVFQARAGTNISGAGEHNRRAVMHALRISGTLSRAQIARATRLVPQTVSNIIEELEREGLVRATSPVKGGRGQPATPYSIASSGAYAFGMQIDQHRARIVAVDLVGTVLAQAETSFERGGIESNMARVMNAYGTVSEAVSSRSSTIPRLVGIGVAMPAPTGVHARRMDPWIAAGKSDSHPLIRSLAARTGLPVSLHHDASAAAVAERLKGAAVGVENFVYIFVGYGLGAGLFMRGELYLGRNRLAGELGLLPYHTDKGSVPLESVASLASLCARLRLEPNSPDFYGALSRGFDSGAADDWLTQAAEALSWLFDMVGCMLDPDRIVLGGQMPVQLMQALFDRAKRASARRSPPDGIVRAPVVMGGADAFNVAAGAASYQIAAAFDPSLSAILKGPLAQALNEVSLATGV